jgi:hypothetical protein
LVVLIACTAAPQATPSTPPSSDGDLIVQLTDEPFGEASVDAAVAIFAANGVATYETPEAESPVQSVSEPTVPFKLLLDQVRVMAFEVNGEVAGIGGAELDTIVVTEPDVAPPSYILAGYVAAADTPGSVAARQIMRAEDWGVEEWRRAPDVVFPQLVMVLFLADVVREQMSVETADDSGPALAGFAPLQADRPVAPGVDELVAQSGPCSAVANFISGALRTVFDALKLGEPKRGVFAVLTRIWNYVVSIVEDVVRGIVKAFTDQVLHAIGRAAAIVGTISTIISIVKPWKTTLQPLPITTEKGIEGIRPVEHGNLIAKVAVPGPQEWPSWAQDCARQAGRALPNLRPEGANVTWGQVRQEPPALITVDATAPRLDYTGAAQLNFTTLVDFVDEPYVTLTGSIWAHVSIERPGLQDLLDVAKRELWSEIPSVVVGPLQAFLGPSIANIESSLRTLVTVSRAGGGWVRYHVQQPGASRDPNDPTCTNGCASSAGDPHLITVDGSEYDFQAAGEFVLMRSADGAFELQARQEPWPGHDTISFNTVAAVRLGGSRLIFSEADEQVSMTLDGVPLIPGTSTDVGDASLIVEPEGFAATLADGTQLYVFGLVGDGVNVVLAPSAGLDESGRGLLARVPVGGMGVPALPNGTVMPPTEGESAYFEALYGPFANAWRVTSQSSLFEYLPGESTDTFTVPDFPAEYITLTDLTPAQLDMGMSACEGVDSEVLREMCIFDAGVTNDDDFGTLYDITDNVMTTGEITVTVTAERTRPPRAPVTAGAEATEPP